MEHSRFYYWQRMKVEFKGAKGCSVGYSEGELSLKYHDTVVARFDLPTGHLTLDHGGWRTYYTKERINRFCDVLGLPVAVFQHKKRFQIDHVAGLDSQRVDWGHIDEGDAPEVCIETGFKVAS